MYQTVSLIGASGSLACFGWFVVSSNCIDPAGAALAGKLSSLVGCAVASTFAKLGAWMLARNGCFLACASSKFKNCAGCVVLAAPRAVVVVEGVQ